ncbi:C4-dicarboxylate ABC transporter permease [Chromatiales bacterium (ex Bugula neritina AB1)]|nr:C4-dicarboxylate ABC transporter permease [Chromatiales bacterium (ex Bugula neritina AB1)]
MAGIGLLALVLTLLLFRQNVVVLLLAAAAYVHLVWGDGQLIYLIEDLWISLDNEVLLAIPMFLIAGNLMTRGSIARRLIEIARVTTTMLPGGLGVATILSCALFAAISGSSPVTLLAVGSILYPALLQNGYSRRFALGAVTSGGTLGIVIPPSIPLILYGLVTEKSIADLFIAGVIPGLMLTTALASYALWHNRKLPTSPFDGRLLYRAVKDGIWALLMPVILLGGIYTGYFSPTEAAAVALAYGLFVEMFIHRELGLKDFFATTVDTAKMLGMLFPIVAVALSLKTILTIEGIPQAIATWVSDTVPNKIAFLLAVNLLLLLVGCLFDVVSAILILAPLLIGPAMALGIDPIHLGIIMVINLEIGFLTPPIGLNLIVAMTAFKESFREICIAVLPFISIILVVLLIVTLVPQTALVLVR